MISILIPTYAYNAYPLVKELYNQCLDINLTFEILCFDNGSKAPTDLDNQKINDLAHCTFRALENNGGRSKIRNTLAEQAKYHWLLFLDADVWPVTTTFIENYTNAIKENTVQVAFSGLKYKDNLPIKQKSLRWTYGKAREEISFKKRKLAPQQFFTSANFMIAKELLYQYPFDESLTKYGYEDDLLAQQLNKNGIGITQLDNPVYHLGLDDNKVFLDKTEKAVENIFYLYQINKISYKSNRLLNSFYWLTRMKLIGFMRIVFAIGRKSLQQNLCSKKPAMFCYDLYKLGYLCSIANSKLS